MSKQIQQILITGISGFVGSHLVKRLLSDYRDQLKISGTYFDKRELPSLNDYKDKIDLQACDIGDAQQVQKVVSEIKPDYICHLAAMSSGAETDREKVFQVNVEGTLNILRACQDLNKKVRVLLASTGYVYGSTDDKQPFTESDSVNPHGIYAESKLEMEKQALELAPKNVEVIISRAFNHTGPGQTQNFVVPAFAQQIAEIEIGNAKPVIQVGNLEAVRDFFDVEDAVRAYKLLLEKGRSGEIYNLASSQAVKISEILNKLLTLSDKKIKIEQDPDRMRPSDIAYSVGSFQKIKDELDWQPTIDLDKMLAKVLDYWRIEAKK